MKTKSKTRNPFPGLRPFNPDESDYFFGRETEGEEIVERLLNNRFVAIIGASASGKSSLVNCGVLPRIQSLSSDINHVWKVFSIKPGNDPVGNLCRSLHSYALATGRKDASYDEIIRLLKEEPDGLTAALKKLGFGYGERVLVIVDQFEELFRYVSLSDITAGEEESRKFVDLVTGITGTNEINLYTLIAIRSDLVSGCSNYKKLTRLINDSSYFIPRISSESLESVIKGPVIRAGASIEESLVSSLAGSVTDKGDYLPLLQHSLMRTWTRWEELDEPETPLSYPVYESAGTIQNSISRHGNALYEELDTDEKTVCEKLFKLITGKGPDNKGIRYPMQLKNVKAGINCSDDQLKKVIEKFSSKDVSFLNPPSGTGRDDNSIIDLAHESLTHLWDRLKNWIDEEADSVQLYLRLSEAAELYQQGKKTLLKPPELQLAIEWREKNKPGVQWAQKYNPAFERAIVYLRTSEKEFLESEERKTRHQKWRLRRIKIISSVLGAMVLVASVAMAGIFISRLTVEKKLRSAEVQKKEVEAQKTMADQFATLAIKKSIESDSVATAAAQKEEKERILREAAQKEILTVKKETVESRQKRLEAEKSAKVALETTNETKRLRMISVAKAMALRSLQVHGQKDVQALLAYQAYLFNKKNNGQANDADIYQGLYNMEKQNHGTALKSFGGYEGKIRDLSFIPGKNEFITSGSDGKILRWNLNNPGQTCQVIYSDSAIYGVIKVSPDASWLACGSENSKIMMIPLNGQETGYELKSHSGSIKSLIFSYDGKYLYSASIDGKVLKWDLSARTSFDMATGSMKINSIDISSDNKYIAGISSDGKALIWNPEAVSENFRIESEGRSIKTIRFKPDEEKIAIGYSDGRIEIWDISSRRIITGFTAHSGEITNIRYNKKTGQVATSGADGSLKLWDSSDFNAIPVSFTDNGGLVLTFEFSPDGELIVSGDISEKNNLVARPTYADAFAVDGCMYVTRNFTPEEWLAYVGKDIEYEKTCPESGSKIKIRELR